MLTKDQIIQELEIEKQKELNQFIASIIPDEAQVYIGGGFVRDVVAGKNVEEINDIDYQAIGICDEEIAKQVCEKFGCTYSKIGANISRINIKDGFDIDIASYEKGKTIQDVAASWDFTINTFYFSLKDKTELIDVYNGYEDIKNQKVRLISKDVINNNYRIILRAARFVAKLDFEIEKDTLETFNECRNKYAKTDINHVRSNLIAMLNIKQGSAKAVKMLVDNDFISPVLPECKSYSPIDRDNSTAVLNKAIKVIDEVEKLQCYISSSFRQKLNSEMFQNVSYLSLIKFAALFNDISQINPIIQSKKGFRLVENYNDCLVPAHNIFNRLNTHADIVNYVSMLIYQSRYAKELVKINKNQIQKMTEAFSNNLKENYRDVMFFTMANEVALEESPRKKEQIIEFYVGLIENLL